MSLAILIGVRCQACCRWRNPAEIIPLPGGANVCVECDQRHQEALEALITGTFLGECSECHKREDALRTKHGHMLMHYEAGVYRIMCVACNETYIQRRREMYGDTEYGAIHKLK